MQTIGLISDTHFPRRGKKLPQKVISTFKEANVSLIIHAGDFEDLAVINELEQIAPVSGVHGNMCNAEVRAKYPASKILHIEDLIIGVTHGSQGPDGFYERIMDTFDNGNMPDIIIYGHTHKAEQKKIGKTLFINPGSPTDRKFAKQNSIALLKIKGSEIDIQFVLIE